MVATHIINIIFIASVIIITTFFVTPLDLDYFVAIWLANINLLKGREFTLFKACLILEDSPCTGFAEFMANKIIIVKVEIASMTEVKKYIKIINT